LMTSMKLGSWMKLHIYIIAHVDVIQPYGWGFCFMHVIFHHFINVLDFHPYVNFIMHVVSCLNIVIFIHKLLLVLYDINHKKWFNHVISIVHFISIINFISICLLYPFYWFRPFIHVIQFIHMANHDHVINFIHQFIHMGTYMCGEFHPCIISCIDIQIFIKRLDVVKMLWPHFIHV
jgi:hypothetical protein